MKTIVSTIIVSLLSCISFVHAQQNIPSDFPKYQDTGNQKADNAAYDQTKKAWVEANPEAYRKMGGQPEVKSISEAQNAKKKDGVAAMIPDNVDYDQAKKEWIEANPEAYQKMGGQPEAKPDVDDDEVETQIENCEKADNLTIAIPDNCITWRITDAVVIDENDQLKTIEFNKEQAVFEEEMLTAKVLWKISSEDMLYILSNGQYATHFKFEKVDAQLKLFPPNDTSCNKQIKIFHIKKWTDNQIVINMPDEDEGSTLVYQLTLIPAF